MSSQPTESSGTIPCEEMEKRVPLVALDHRPANLGAVLHGGSAGHHWFPG